MVSFSLHWLWIVKDTMPFSLSPTVVFAYPLRPCAVILGITSIGEARDLVTKAYPNFVLQNEQGCDNIWTMTLVGDAATLYINLNYRDCSYSDPVELITLSEQENRKDSVLLGDIYQILGAPDQTIMSGDMSTK